MKLIDIEDEILLKNLFEGGRSAKQVIKLFIKQPSVEAIPISFIEKKIEERIEQEQWELDTYGEYNQMAWVYSHLIDEWRKENE